MCYNTHMGMYKGKNGYYILKCDFKDGCGNEVQLHSKDFWEALAESKKLKWITKKNKDGRWVNFCTEFCEVCYFAPQARIKVKKYKVNTQTKAQ